MNTRKNIRVIILGILCVLFLNNRMSTAESARAKEIPLRDYVYSVCPRLRCHIVFEDRAESRLTNALVHDERNVNSVSALAAFLGKEIAHTVVTIYANNVISIKDESIANDKEYPLDKVLSLNYSGLLDSLPDMVGYKLNGCVRTANGGDLSMAGNYDGTSSITLIAKHETVRSLLTNHLPLNRYHAILWDAQTKIRSGKEISYIQFWMP